MIKMVLNVAATTRRRKWKKRETERIRWRRWNKRKRTNKGRRTGLSGEKGKGEGDEELKDKKNEEEKGRYPFSSFSHSALRSLHLAFPLSFK